MRRENEALAGHNEALRFIEGQFARVPEYLAKLKHIQSTMSSLESTSRDMKKRVKQVHDKCIETALAKTVEEDMRAAEEKRLQAKPSAALQKELDQEMDNTTAEAL